MGPEVKFAPIYNFFVNLELIFEKIHPFLNIKMTFFKNKYGELHWKAAMILLWTLFVKFWVPEHGSGVKKWQLSISAKVSMGHFLETIRDTELKFLWISYIKAPNPNFIKIWEGHLGKYLKTGHFCMEWPGQMEIQKFGYWEQKKLFRWNKKYLS